MPLRIRQEIQTLPRPVELSHSISDADRESIDVVVGVIVDSNRRVLIAQRPAGKHMAGAWEFPGGKRESGEARLDALRRELREEIGIDVVQAEPLLELEHEYADFRVRLDVWWVEKFANEPAAIEDQALRWVSAAELAGAAMLPADGPIVAMVSERLVSLPG